MSCRVAFPVSTGKNTGITEMLERALAVIGPPAAGKTTLTMQLGRMPGVAVFRLREHVPDTMLAATATSAQRLGWLDDLTVTRALRGYLETVIRTGTVHAVLLDNFPGSDTQARLLVSVLRKLAPQCVVHVVELVINPAALQRRVLERRVCHQCEHDPIHDPRLPAEANPSDPRRCAHCNSILHPRRGDAPRLLTARVQRYNRAAIGIRSAFTEVGIEVLQLDSNRPPEQTASELSLLLATRSTLL
jgi:adenylate kinase